MDNLFHMTALSKQQFLHLLFQWDFWRESNLDLSFNDQKERRKTSKLSVVSNGIDVS